MASDEAALTEGETLFTALWGEGWAGGAEAHGGEVHVASEAPRGPSSGSPAGYAIGWPQPEASSSRWVRKETWMRPGGEGVSRC